MAQWHDVFATHHIGNPIQALLSLIVARGTWPDVFLTTMKTGIEAAEGSLGASIWSVYWDTATNPRTILDPGRSMEDGSPVHVSDPMYGVWSAAAYNPQWFLDTYQGHDLVDITYGRAGYDGSEFRDGSDFDHLIPTHAQVDSALHSLFTERGFDQASLNAFLMAASIANTWQSLTTNTTTVAVQVDHLFSALDYQQAEWAALPWWDKYKHEILAAFSAAAGITAMFIPGPGWITGSLLVASFAAGAVDVGLYITEGDYWSAALTGVFLIPLMIGGTIRLVQLTRLEWEALKTGETITVVGQRFGLVDGKITRFTSAEWDALTGQSITGHGDSGILYLDGKLIRLDRGQWLTFTRNNGTTIIDGHHYTLVNGRLTPVTKFTSDDPLVADLADKIEATWPGSIKGVNSYVPKIDGKFREVDIQLDNVYIQVKSDNAKRLIAQMLETQATTGKPVVAYAPTMPEAAYQEAIRQGLKVARTPEELIAYLQPYL